MAAGSDDTVQLNIRVTPEIHAELEALVEIYGMSKSAIGEALLAHSLCDDQVEIALQKAKDAGDRRLRALRSKQLEAVPAAPPSATPIRKRLEQKS